MGTDFKRLAVAVVAGFIVSVLIGLPGRNIPYFGFLTVLVGGMFAGYVYSQKGALAGALSGAVYAVGNILVLFLLNMPKHGLSPGSIVIVVPIISIVLGALGGFVGMKIAGLKAKPKRRTKA